MHLDLRNRSFIRNCNFERQQYFISIRHVILKLTIVAFTLDDDPHQHITPYVILPTHLLLSFFESLLCNYNAMFLG